MSQSLSPDDNVYRTMGPSHTTSNNNRNISNDRSNNNNNHHPVRRQVSQIDAPLVKTGILGTSSNLVNSIVGAGIIGIPFALGEAGLVVGVVLLILVSVATDKTLRMIVELASFHPTLRHLGVHTFEDLMRIPFGNWGSNFILFSMFVLAYGAMVAYLLIVKDTVRC